MSGKKGSVPLLTSTPRVINVGLELFHRSLQAQGATVTHVDWRPPAGGDARLATLLDRLSGRRPS